jgi:hypothetical protein
MMMAQDQFGERLGSERVRLWTSQGEVEREKLDPALCYIQITSVDAYFTPEEAQTRVTYFERYNNLRTTTLRRASSLFLYLSFSRSLNFRAHARVRVSCVSCRAIHIRDAVYGGRRWPSGPCAGPVEAEDHPHRGEPLPLRQEAHSRAPQAGGALPFPTPPRPRAPIFPRAPKHSSMFPPKLTCVCVCVCVCVRAPAMNVCISGWMSRHA